MSVSNDFTRIRVTLREKGLLVETKVSRRETKYIHLLGMEYLLVRLPRPTWTRYVQRTSRYRDSIDLIRLRL